ncbi:hypothetical protein J7F01_37210 [Streptomyces sp. ISL-22]|uniref:Uncharacterized protein n=1 Tax=Streptomyces curacoi TaxID=146536 RepID=A0A117NTH0_9ACTN|nr:MULTISPECIES: hypothetical protein [Streptomyces]KUM67122.1 hypothetical protein AQI70_36620 [Streptomyces curacoi]MBT2419035.1 hypothetical protein [Streptomyces sp. ISL-24]MBT2437680.1 hypothetical protein [Streptomyces sp. ISL-22]
MPSEGYHVVRQHIRRNPKSRGKKLGGWTIAGIAAFVWLWGQIFGFGDAEADKPATPAPSASVSASSPR